MSISKFKIHRRAQFCYSSMIKIPQTMKVLYILKVLYIFHPKRRLPWNVFKESGTFTILGFPTKKIAFFAWLWPIEAEMENKPSNCWLWLKAMMMKWKCTRTHLHKLSTELFAFRIPEISWNLISTKMRHKMISGVNIWRVSTYLRNHLKYRAFSAKWN